MSIRALAKIVKGWAGGDGVLDDFNVQVNDRTARRVDTAYGN